MDWKKVVEDIRSNGATKVEIAKRCGMSAAWVGAVAEGRVKSVGWEAGDKLLKFQQVMKKRAAIN